jgi:hypothetical protein
MKKLRDEGKAHAGGKLRTILELREQLVELRTLYENRYSHGTDTLEELVAAGYYGPIIRAAWLAEGRIAAESEQTC